MQALPILSYDALRLGTKSTCKEFKYFEMALRYFSTHLKNRNNATTKNEFRVNSWIYNL